VSDNDKSIKKKKSKKSKVKTESSNDSKIVTETSSENIEETLDITPKKETGAKKKNSTKKKTTKKTQTKPKVESSENTTDSKDVVDNKADKKKDKPPKKRRKKKQTIELAPTQNEKPLATIEVVSAEKETEDTNESIVVTDVVEEIVEDTPIVETAEQVETKSFSWAKIKSDVGGYVSNIKNRFAKKEETTSPMVDEPLVESKVGDEDTSINEPIEQTNDIEPIVEEQIDSVTNTEKKETLGSKLEGFYNKLKSQFIKPKTENPIISEEIIEEPVIENEIEVVDTPIVEEKTESVTEDIETSVEDVIKDEEVILESTMEDQTPVVENIDIVDSSDVKKESFFNKIIASFNNLVKKKEKDEVAVVSDNESETQEITQIETIAEDKATPVTPVESKSDETTGIEDKVETETVETETVEKKTFLEMIGFKKKSKADTASVDGTTSKTTTEKEAPIDYTTSIEKTITEGKFIYHLVDLEELEPEPEKSSNKLYYYWKTLKKKLVLMHEKLLLRPFLYGLLKLGLGTLCFTIFLTTISTITYFGFLEYSYQRFDNEEDMKVTGRRTWVSEIDTEYTVTTYSIGYGIFDSQFSYARDSGKMNTGRHVNGLYTQTSNSGRAMTNTNRIATFLNELKSDFYLLQDVDTGSTRSYLVNQQELLTNNVFGYSKSFTSNQHSKYIFYPLGKNIGLLNSGLLTMSRYTSTHSTRLQLPTTTDWLEKHSDLDHCANVSYIPISGQFNEGVQRYLVLINVEFMSYNRDVELLNQQWVAISEWMQYEYDNGNYVIVGGDFGYQIGSIDDVFLGEQALPEWLTTFPTSTIPENFSMVFANNSNEVRTVRSGEMIYNKDVNLEMHVDGFIVSDNIEALSSEIIDTEFKTSNHNPVKLTFKLKKI